jgi:hypothetical protein
MGRAFAIGGYYYMYLREIGWDVCGLHSSGSEQEK